MENELRDKRQKSYTLMRRIYDFTMALLILGMAVVMLGARKFNIEQLLGIDDMFRYLFGGVCLLYGGFRLYRGFKSEY